MGGGKWNDAGGRGKPETFQYEKVGEIGGVKVIAPKDPSAPGVREGLPMFSNTLHTYYFNRNKEGVTDQLKIYRGGVAVLEIDWGHDHTARKEGRTPDPDKLHVHVYKRDKNGEFDRKDRPIDPREWKVLKKLLLQANRRLKP